MKEVTGFVSPGFPAWIPTSGDKDVLPPLDAESEPFTGEVYFLLSGWQKGGQSVILAFDIPLVILIQVLHYAIEVYFSMICPGPWYFH